MEVRQKPCKAIGKSHGFKSCGKPTFKRTHGLCPKCLFEFYTTDERGKVMYAKFNLKVKSVTKAREKEKTKELVKKSTNWRAKTQTKVQEIIRYIDRGQKCPARGYTNFQAHAGHVYARGGNSSMALNLHAMHRQSAQSNHWQNDDGIFRDGLALEYGKEYLDFIGNLRRTPQLKYKNDDYHDFYKKASKIALKLKKNDFGYPIRTRIQLRNELNLELGIYDPEYCVFRTPANFPN